MDFRLHRWLSGPLARCHRSVPIALALFFLSVMAFAFDGWVGREAYRFPWPAELYQLILFTEIFGHGLGVLAIVVVVAVLDPQPSLKVYRLGWCAFGAGLVANVGKLLVPRLRPHFASASGSIWSSFGGSEITHWADMWDYSLHSFPSAHAATAMGLAIGLGYCYPRGRYLFLVIGAFACFQRIVIGAHFLSDVLAGAAVGVCVATIALRRIERRYGDGSAEPDVVKLPTVTERRRSA